ncbi:MAG: hypothetical protein LZF61_10980 [Nitrosomonas sp.]|nr:MAG: hypothetical protein LZF61_10980 [Nitrosomonas sp.]
MKKMIVSMCTVAILGNVHFALADTASDTETLLNWAEKTYPEIFPSHQATQNIEPWLFRHYPETGVYAGVNKLDNNVYVLGGDWGDAPTQIDTLSNLLDLINNTGGNGNIAACDAANALPGVTYSQSGNVVSVTTGGSCAALPDISAANPCRVPPQATASGISVLSANTVTASSISGITISIPGIPNPFSGLINEAANVKHCTINAPVGQENLIVNSDVCLDITLPVSSALGDLSIPGVTVTPPVTYSMKSTYKSEVVTDCFATDATAVSDVYTGEVWVKKNGEWIKQ